MSLAAVKPSAHNVAGQRRGQRVRRIEDGARARPPSESPWSLQ